MGGRGGARVIVFALLGILSVSPKTSPRVEPTIGVESTIGFRSMTLKQGGETERDYQALYKPLGLSGGVQVYYRSDTNFATGGWKGTFEVGVQFSTPIEGLYLGVAHSSVYEWKIRQNLALFAGPYIGFYAGLPRGEYSHAEVGGALGLSIRRLDIVWNPSLAIPLQFERRDVFNGELRRNVAVLPVPLHLGLRLKIGR